jgi:hypothetical protein
VQNDLTEPGHELSRRRLRAVVEIVDGELKIFPIAETEEQAKEILERLLLWRGENV